MCPCKNIWTHTQDNREGHSMKKGVEAGAIHVSISQAVVRIDGNRQKLGEKHRMNSSLAFTSS